MTRIWAWIDRQRWIDYMFDYLIFYIPILIRDIKTGFKDFR